MIGWSSGLLFETTGAIALVGIERCTCAILACVSCRARSMLRERSNVAVIRADPCLADDESVRTPVTWDIESSIGLMMPVSMSSGDAPGHDTLTDTVGLSTSGYWLIADPRDGDDPEEDGAGHDHPGQDGPAQADVGDVHWACLLRPPPAPADEAAAAGAASPAGGATGEGASDAAAAGAPPSAPAAASVVRSVICTGAPSLSGSNPRTTRSSPALSPCVISTPPSGVCMPRVTLFACAMLFASTV